MNPTRTFHSDGKTGTEDLRGRITRQLQKKYPSMSGEFISRHHMLARIAGKKSAADIKGHIVEAWFRGMSRNQDRREYGRKLRERQVVKQLEPSDDPHLHNDPEADHASDAALAAHRKALRAAQGAEVVESWAGGGGEIEPRGIGGIHGLLVGIHDDDDFHALKAAVESLSGSAFDVLDMHLLWMTDAEIGEQLGISPSAAGRRLRRSKMKIHNHAAVKARRGHRLRGQSSMSNALDNSNTSESLESGTSSQASRPVPASGGLDHSAQEEPCDANSS